MATIALSYLSSRVALIVKVPSTPASPAGTFFTWGCSNPIICVDKMYWDAVAAEAAAVEVPAKEDRGKKKKGSKDAGKESGKHTSSECVVPTLNTTISIW